MTVELKIRREQLQQIADNEPVWFGDLISKAAALTLRDEMLVYCDEKGYWWLENGVYPDEINAYGQDA